MRKVFIRRGRLPEPVKEAPVDLAAIKAAIESSVEENARSILNAHDAGRLMYAVPVSTDGEDMSTASVLVFSPAVGGGLSNSCRLHYIINTTGTFSHLSIRDDYGNGISAVDVSLPVTDLGVDDSMTLPIDSLTVRF